MKADSATVGGKEEAGMIEAPPKELQNFPTGTLIANRYEVQEALGWGGMGLVLKAKDTLLDNETIAIKILYQRFAADRSLLARFKREVILTRRLAHPNILSVYDFGETEDGTCFITMEFVKGKTLKQELEESVPPFEKVIEYIRAISSGLSYAHEQGVIHRDLKPANMLVNETGTVKISDFGVARSLVSMEKLTKTDESVGSPMYMSPEMLGSVGVDHRADIYGLGILGFELAEGHPPFSSENWIILARMHLKDPLPEFKKPIPLWYQELIGRATAKKPSDRFQNMHEILTLIDKNTQETKTKRSNARLVTIMLAALAVLGGILMWR